MCPTHGGRAPAVKRAAAERLADLIDPQRALREAAYIAYSDIRDLFDLDTGQLLPMRDWPPHIARAIASFEVVKGNLHAGDGKFNTVYKFKFWDKSKNLEMLFKHLGPADTRPTHSHPASARTKVSATPSGRATGATMNCWRPRPTVTLRAEAMPTAAPKMRSLR